jgi:hypothetical protein
MLASVHVELPLHQRKLRTQLVDQASRRQGSQPWFLGTFITSFKETLSNMQSRTKIASLAGGFGAVALVAVIAMTVLSTAPVSAAKEQLTKTKTAVRQLSPQEASQLRARVDQRMVERLDEAKDAKDLRLISASEFQKETGLNPAVKLPNHVIKSYVAFTAANGERTIIAVDSNDSPVLVLANSIDHYTVPEGVLAQ